MIQERSLHALEGGVLRLRVGHAGDLRARGSEDSTPGSILVDTTRLGE